IYGVPLLMAALWSTRPIRFGLGIMFLLCMDMIWLPPPFLRGRDDPSVARTRTYFGVLNVKKADERIGVLLEGEGGKIFIGPNPKLRDDPAYMEEYNTFTRPKKEGERPQNFYTYTYLMHGT